MKYEKKEEKKNERKKQTLGVWCTTHSVLFFFFEKKWKTYGLRFDFFYVELEDHYRSCFNYRGLRASRGIMMNRKNKKKLKKTNKVIKSKKI